MFKIMSLINIIILTTIFTACGYYDFKSDKNTSLTEIQGLENNNIGSSLVENTKKETQEAQEAQETTELYEQKESVSNIKNKLSVEEAFISLRESIDECIEISHVPDMDKIENETEYYCFLINYSNIYEDKTPECTLAYIIFNSETEEIYFKEEGYGKMDVMELYTNIPDKDIPIPMIGSHIIPYDFFAPPFMCHDIAIYYSYDDIKILDIYKEQLLSAGFINHGNVMAVDSLWIYDRYDSYDENSKIIIEISIYNDGGFGMAMYVNYNLRAVG